jgi:L-ribulose-5-phosphate 3-epimerase
MAHPIDRREFITVGGGALAGAALSACPAAARDRKNKRPLKKAIMYGTIGYKGTVLEKYQAVKAAGFEGVEPMSDMNQDGVLRAMDATGLRAASVCCNTHWGRPLSHPDAKVRQEGLEGLLRALKDAKRYGATSVLLVPGVVGKKGGVEVSYDECFKRSVQEIRKAVPLAGELGVKIAIENVWNDFITKPEQAIEFLEAIDSPFVGWHFDIGNVLRYGPPETWIPVLGQRIVKLHIKEYSQFKKFSVRFFEGDNNWPAIMSALDKVGYKGWGISEQPLEQSRDAARLKDLSARMDRVFAS